MPEGSAKATLSTSPPTSSARTVWNASFWPLPSKVSAPGSDARWMAPVAIASLPYSSSEPSVAIARWRAGSTPARAPALSRAPQSATIGASSNERTSPTPNASATASKLYLSVRTVESHRAHIQQKLRLSTRAELVHYALEHGMVTPETAEDD